MPNPQTNLRLDTAIRDRAIAAAKAQGITVATLVERALTAYLDGAGDVVSADSDSVSGQIADLIARVEKLEADHFNDVIKMIPQRRPTPPHTTPQTAPSPGAYRGEGEGLSLGNALVSAGAPIPPDVARSTNRSRAMLAATGQSAADWLESRGWEKSKGKWYRG